MVSPAEVLKQLYSGYVGALQGASDFLRDDLPSASPGIAKWAQETGRRACRKYARQRGSIPFLTSDPSWDGICSGYWGAINEAPTSGGSYAPPFTGGQCSGVQYNIRQRVQAWDSNGNFLSDETFVTSGGPGPASSTALPDIPGSPGGTNALGRFTITFANGNTRTYATTGISVTTGKRVSQRDVSLIRADGQTDTCGDPPPKYRPPTFPPNLPSLPTPTNPAPGFGNNWDVNLLPDGQVAICIGGECSTGIPPGGGGGPDSGGGPGEPDGDPQETNPNDPDSPNEVSGCVEDGNLLTGLKIGFTQIPPHQAPLGDIYYRVGWIWMGPDSGKLDLVIDGKTMQDGQFVIPDSRDCTCYKVRANAGWRLSVQAFSRPKEE